MKQTITINTPRDLNQFKREFAHLVDVVKQADGKYVLYVDIDRSPATRSAFITKAQFDEALSPAMRAGSPSAFSPRIAGGRFLPHRLDAAYSSYQRGQVRADVENNRSGPALIRNRQQYIAVYSGDFGLYTQGRIGNFFNTSVTEKFKK